MDFTFSKSYILEMSFHERPKTLQVYGIVHDLHIMPRVNMGLWILTFGWLELPSPPAGHSISDISPGNHHVLQQCPVMSFHGDS